MEILAWLPCYSLTFYKNLP